MEKHLITEICAQPDTATTFCDRVGLSQSAIEINQI